MKLSTTTTTSVWNSGFHSILARIVCSAVFAVLVASLMVTASERVKFSETGSLGNDQLKALNWTNTVEASNTTLGNLTAVPSSPETSQLSPAISSAENRSIWLLDHRNDSLNETFASVTEMSLSILERAAPGAATTVKHGLSWSSILLVSILTPIVFIFCCVAMICICCRPSCCCCCCPDSKSGTANGAATNGKSNSASTSNAKDGSSIQKGGSSSVGGSSNLKDNNQSFFIDRLRSYVLKM